MPNFMTMISSDMNNFIKNAIQETEYGLAIKDPISQGTSLSLCFIIFIVSNPMVLKY